MAFDQETGQADDFYLGRELPAPPASLTPRGTSDDARLIALRAAAAAGVPVVGIPETPASLAIATLDATPDRRSSYEYNAVDRADALAGRSRLVYDVRLFDAHYGTTLVHRPWRRAGRKSARGSSGQAPVSRFFEQA